MRKETMKEKSEDRSTLCFCPLSSFAMLSGALLYTTVPLVSLKAAFALPSFPCPYFPRFWQKDAKSCR